jgi:hypothetical protein
VAGSGPPAAPASGKAAGKGGGRGGRGASSSNGGRRHVVNRLSSSYHCINVTPVPQL